MVVKTAKKTSSSTMSKNDKTKPPPLPNNDRVESALLERALKALLKHHELKESENDDGKKNLIGTNGESVQLQITLARVPQNPSPKPIRIDIPHPLHKMSSSNNDDNKEGDDDEEDGLEEAEVCLIVKESSKPQIQKLISTFPKHLSHIKKVLGLDSLRKKYGRYEQRRDLLHKYNFFMVDDRILPMVGKQLGKNFFAMKKQPIPIKITREEALPFAVERCLRATYMYLPAGTCLTIKAGYTSMSTTKLLSNIQSILSNAIPKVPKKWANICALSIKTSSSTSLPFYNKTPEELIEIAKLAGVSEKNDDAALAKRKREEKEEEGEEPKMKSEERKKEKKRQKKELAAKSPLVRALKKQKQEEEKEEAAEPTKEAEKEEEKEKKEEEQTKSSKKKRKKEKKTKAEETVKEKEAEEEEDVSDKPQQKKKAKKSKTDANDDEPTAKASEKKEKKTFIASKKFKGAKSGYAFRMGNEGLGYYIDTPPKADPMLMDALIRSSQKSPGRGRGSGGGGGSGKRGKSMGGRRKSRR